MNNKNFVVLFLAYGSPSSYHQAMFSILTLYYHLEGKFEGIRVVIYTDNAAFFNKYADSIPLSTEVIDADTLKRYKGKQNFVHRVKICILQDCFAKYQADIFYLDADTYFTQSPVQLLQLIGPETSIMNSNDYDLISAAVTYENGDWLNIRRVIRDHSYTIEGRAVSIPLTTRMWNAGVIGMSRHNAGLLDQVLDLTDQIYANRVVFTAEQFAFSYFLQNKTKLISSGEVIFHYWHAWGPNNHKHTYTYHINHFFKENKHAAVAEQALGAFMLTQRHGQLKLPKPTVIDKVLHRLKLIYLVALKGKIPKSI